jgi:hypothetical protein
MLPTIVVILQAQQEKILTILTVKMKVGVKTSIAARMVIMEIPVLDIVSVPPPILSVLKKTLKVMGAVKRHVIAMERSVGTKPEVPEAASA